MEKVIQTQSLPDFNEQSKQEHIEKQCPNTRYQVWKKKQLRKRLRMKILKPCNNDTNQNLLQ